MLRSQNKIKYLEDKIPDKTNLATNTTLNPQIKQVKQEIPSINNLATTDVNVKINEFENKKLIITNLPATTALTVVESKMPNVRNLVKN